MTTTADAVYQKSSSTGTGNFVLTAATGYRTFAAAFPDNALGNRFFYHIRHKSSGAFETGFGYLDSGALVRNQVLASSNGGALVNFEAGQKVIVNDIPAFIQDRFFTFPSVEKTANFIFSLDEMLKLVEANSASTITGTIPPDSDVAFPIGTVLTVVQMGAGNAQIAAGAGVTIRTAETLKAAKRYAVMSARKRAANEWLLFGNLEAAP